MFEITLIMSAIVGLNQLIKKYVPSRFIPLASLILGVVGGIFFIDGPIKESIGIGILMGLSACGLYDAGKIPFKK